jgi:hypothetical protein
MTTPSLALDRAARAVEAYQIHLATCRSYRQRLICSCCLELFERQLRALAAWKVAA